MQHAQTAQFNVARRTVWRIMAAYAKHKVHEQRGAAVGSGSTDRNRRTFNRTDASDINAVQHCTGHPRSSKEDWRKGSQWKDPFQMKNEEKKKNKYFIDPWGEIQLFYTLHRPRIHTHMHKQDLHTCINGDMSEICPKKLIGTSPATSPHCIWSMQGLELAIPPGSQAWCECERWGGWVKIHTTTHIIVACKFIVCPGNKPTHDYHNVTTDQQGNTLCTEKTENIHSKSGGRYFKTSTTTTTTTSTTTTTTIDQMSGAGMSLSTSCSLVWKSMFF